MEEKGREAEADRRQAGRRAAGGVAGGRDGGNAGGGGEHLVISLRGVRMVRIDAMPVDEEEE